MTDDSRLHTPRARWIALVVVCLGQLMSIVDGTIVNVALPQIQRDLHFTQSNLTWVLNGYLITFGSFLLLAGRLGDLVGRRRIFLTGVTGFTLASAACGLAQSQEVLVIARFLQGLAGAGAVAAIVAIITAEFPAPRERAKAMSIYTLVISGGASLGLIAGGVITEALNWHWIFFVNVPIGIVTVLLGRRWITENVGLGIGRDIDVLGSALITAALIVGAYAIVTASSHGWGSAHTLGFGALSVALMAAFVALEARLRNPIMPLRVFRIPGLASSSFIRGLLITGMFATFFIGVLYLERIRGYGALTAGLAFLPQTVLLAALSLGPIAWMVNRFGPAPPAHHRPVLRRGRPGPAVDRRRAHRVRPGARRRVPAHGPGRRHVVHAAADDRHGPGARRRRRAGQRHRQHLAAGLRRHRGRRAGHRLRRPHPRRCWPTAAGWTRRC